MRAPPSQAAGELWSHRPHSSDKLAEPQYRDPNNTPARPIKSRAQLSVMTFLLVLRQKAIDMFWLHFWGALMSSFFIAIPFEMSSWQLVSSVVFILRAAIVLSLFLLYCCDLLPLSTQKTIVM